MSVHLAATPSKPHVTFPPLGMLGLNCRVSFSGGAELLNDPMDSLRETARVQLTVLRN